jgi:hypothetical protein
MVNQNLESLIYFKVLNSCGSGMSTLSSSGYGFSTVTAKHNPPISMYIFKIKPLG